LRSPSRVTPAGEVTRCPGWLPTASTLEAATFAGPGRRDADPPSRIAPPLRFGGADAGWLRRPACERRHNPHV